MYFCEPVMLRLFISVVNFIQIKETEKYRMKMTSNYMKMEMILNLEISY
jgi:hypothetical protein